MSLWPRLGIAVLVIGFAAGLNPLIVIAASALTTGLAAGLAPLHIITPQEQDAWLKRSEEVLATLVHGGALLPNGALTRAQPQK